MILTFYRLLYTFILTRRYKITIKGHDVLKTDNPKLFLANHQSHLDPQIVAMEMYKYSEIVPVASERFFRTPIVRFFLKKTNAISVSDFRLGNRDRNVLKTISTGAIKALKDNKSVMIFPSGQLTSNGIEKIGGKQSAYAVVSEMPENAKVIGVHVSGLWGSMWSKAWDGTRPIFLKTFIKAAIIFFANFIFFIPKRKITLEFVDITNEAKQKGATDRKTFNLFLENFYAQKGKPKLVYIRHLFYFPLLGKKKKIEKFEK